jgi:hypothetical protein
MPWRLEHEANPVNRANLRSNPQNFGQMKPVRQPPSSNPRERKAKPATRWVAMAYEATTLRAPGCEDSQVSNIRKPTLTASRASKPWIDPATASARPEKSQVSRTTTSAKPPMKIFRNAGSRNAWNNWMANAIESYEA